ncbi:MAG: hypothetical protein ABIH00_03760, partial [Armatimonadota bacterium]
RINIDNPQANNQAQIQIPANAQPGNYKIVAAVSPYVNFSNHVAELNVIIGMTRADVRITAPAPNTSFTPGQQVQVNVTVLPEAASAARSLRIKLKHGNQVLIQQIIQNPQSNNSQSITIPGNIPPGEAIIEATLDPAEDFINHTATQNIRIENIDAGIRITSPQAGIVLRAGQQIDVVVAMNPEAVGLNITLKIKVKRAGQDLAIYTIQRPQVNNNQRITIPANIPEGEAVIEAILDPVGSFINHSATINFRVEKINANLSIPIPAEGTVFIIRDAFIAHINMNPEAVGVPSTLDVKLMKAGQMLDQEVIQNPQANTEVRLQIPRISPGNATVEASLRPEDGLTQTLAVNNITINAVNAALSIMEPPSNHKIKRGRTLIVRVTMTDRAASITNELTVEIEKDGERIARKIIRDPSRNERVRLEIPGPGHIEPGMAIIKATLSPGAYFTSNTKLRNIEITP